jgi:pimeloyl-ACP methyl ester carboxylesterase
MGTVRSGTADGGRTRGHRFGLVVGVAVALVLAGCSGAGSDDVVPLPEVSDAPTTDPASDPALAGFYRQQVSWGDCGDGFECAQVMVPVDWATPSGETITLAAKRLPASGDRIGSLFINPGGPGVSGVEFADSARLVFDKKVRKSFDIVGWDPRGIEASAPVECLDDAQLEEYLASESSPNTPDEEKTAVTSVEEFAQSCQDSTGPILEHVDTISTAKDMDVLRAVVGDERLSYYGGSYGTFLGAWYAELFPWRVGRLVLDGAVDPSLTSEEYAQGQADGFQQGLLAYLEDCRDDVKCPLKGTDEQMMATLSQLVAQTDEHPLLTDDPDRPLTQALFVTGFAMALYSDQYWDTLDTALAEALKGNGTTFLLLADSYNDRDEAGRYGQVMEANMAIYCLDHGVDADLDQIRAFADQLGAEYPPFGETMGWGVLGCSVWPIAPVLQPQELTAEGADPILVIGTTGDPATPYEWAQGLADQLSSGVLLTWEGEGHTAYGRAGDCVDDTVEAYLLSGTAPEPGTVCG